MMNPSAPAQKKKEEYIYITSEFHDFIAPVQEYIANVMSVITGKDYNNYCKCNEYQKKSLCIDSSAIIRTNETEHVIYGLDIKINIICTDEVFNSMPKIDSIKVISDPDNEYELIRDYFLSNNSIIFEKDTNCIGAENDEYETIIYPNKEIKEYIDYALEILDQLELYITKENKENENNNIDENNENVFQALHIFSEVWEQGGSARVRNHEKTNKESGFVTTGIVIDG